MCNCASVIDTIATDYTYTFLKQAIKFNYKSIIIND